MHSLLLIVLVASGSCLAHYRGYKTHNLIEREEPLNEENGVLVECPVCKESVEWMPSFEVCPITIGNKKYKKCELGTYINTVCGNQRDCYRGAGEQCTVKREFDMYGQRCAPGYYCNKPLGVCQGLDYVVDSKIQYLLNPNPYSIRPKINNGLAKNDYIRSD